MTDNENMKKLEQKLETYKYLFAQGNESPSERQVESWMEYLDNGLRKNQEERELSVEEKVERKATILGNAGFYSRARVLEDRLKNFRTAKETPPLTGIDKYIKQMEIRAREYLPDLLRSRDALLLHVIIQNYLSTDSATKNEDALKATKSLQQLLEIKHSEHRGRFSGHNQLQDFRGLLGEDITEVLFDIEQLAHLGINNGVYGIKFSREGYQTAMGNIRQRRTEREKNGKTFDRIIFMSNKLGEPGRDEWENSQWSEYLIAEMKAEVPYKALFMYNNDDYHPNTGGWIKDQIDDLAKSFGSGRITIGKEKVLTCSHKKVTGYELSHYPAVSILRQYYGNSKKIEWR